ncbi:peptide ABC transporter substrate-binding protein [Mollicutes bacterium LVI A0078]|nr:peptide ABC transporter substrate-binding protein [Mollicutes bacterium LVI A0075]WOO91196.1 peptide ABC transporter substrate-binding protein [Mollicutes bacterium LVI A0078]
MKRIFIAIFSLVLILSGCSSEASSFTYLVNQAVETMDPVDASYSQTFQLFADIYLGPNQINQDGDLVLGNAESIDVSDDQLTYTIHLRDDVYWVNNNGEQMAPVTAQDYVNGYKRMVDPTEASIFSYIFEVIDGANEIISGDATPDTLAVDLVDDYTFTITLDYVAPYFESMLAFGSFVPQPTEAISEYGEDYGLTAETTWYNGAYYVSEYDPEYIITLEKNPLYINSDNVQLEKIDFRLNEDSSSRYNAFLNGEADYGEITTPEDYALGIEEGQVNDKMTSYSYYAVLNAADSAVTSNKDLRMALAYGFDRQTITEGVYGDINKPIEYIIPADLTTSSYGGVDYHDYSSDSLITYDPDKANEYFDKYMEEAGISDRSDISIELLASADATGNSKFAEVVQSSYLQNFGINIELTVQPFEQFLASKKSGAFDMYLQSWGPDYADPSTYLSLWQSSQIGSQNYAGYNNPEYDELYNKAVVETDTDTRFEEFAQLEKMIVDDGVAIPFFQLNSPYVITDGYTMPFDSFNSISHEYITYQGE